MYKVYYANGSTYSGDPLYAPALGVLVIVESDPEHGRRIIQNADYYLWDDRGDGLRWFESDYPGLIDYLIQPGAKRVLFGRLVPNCIFQAVFTKAYNDPDFEPKTGWTPRPHGRKV